jgi:hypothetical protein
MVSQESVLRDWRVLQRLHFISTVCQVVFVPALDVFACESSAELGYTQASGRATSKVSAVELG